MENSELSPKDKEVEKLFDEFRELLTKARNGDKSVSIEKLRIVYKQLNDIIHGDQNA